MNINEFETFTFNTVKRDDIFPNYRLLYDIAFELRNYIDENETDILLGHIVAGENELAFEFICGAIRFYQIPLTTYLYELIIKVGSDISEIDPKEWHL
jgi:hypothetical protein